MSRMAGFLQHPDGKAFPMSRHTIVSIGPKDRSTFVLSRPRLLTVAGLTSQLCDIIVTLNLFHFKKSIEQLTDKLINRLESIYLGSVEVNFCSRRFPSLNF